MAQHHQFPLATNNRRSAIAVSELINHQSPPPDLSSPAHSSLSPSPSASPSSSTVHPPSPAYSPHFRTTSLLRTSPIRKHNPSSSLSPTQSCHNPNTATRGPWRVEEDRLLMQLVHRYGARHWSLIANHFPRRTGKQARERWLNQLDPALKKKNWTAEEDNTILHAHAKKGNRWSAIAKLLPGRTDNSVKNRFNSTLKRAMRERDQAGVPMHIHDIVASLHARPFYPEPPHHAEPAPCPAEFYYQPTRTTTSSATYDSTTSDERDLWVRGANCNTRMAPAAALTREHQHQQPQHVHAIQCRDSCLPSISHVCAAPLMDETPNNRAIR